MSGAKQKSSTLRLAALALFIGAPALLLGLGAINGLQYLDDDLAGAEKRAQIAALTHRLDAKASDGQPTDLSAIYVAGASRSLASANLQQLLFDAISAASGHVIEITSLDAEADAAAEATNDLRLKTVLDTDTPGLLQLLYKLEAGLPLLRVETLTIRKLPNEDDAAVDRLRIELSVRGAWRPKRS